MKKSAAILLEYQIAVDYCQPTLREHSIAREVVDYIYEEGIQLDIRKSCWQSLTSSLTNVLELFQYLKREATASLREYNSQQALDKYLTNILTSENLKGQPSFSLNQDHMPDIDALRRAVGEVGIENFRAYADDQIQTCVRGQERLDWLINQRFERGGQSVGLFNAVIESQFDRKHNIDLLTTAYVWGTKVNGYLLTRQNSTIYSRKQEIYDGMSNQKFRIISPQDVKQYIS